VATVEELIEQVEGLTEYERKNFLAVVLEKYGIAANPIPAVAYHCNVCGLSYGGPHACPGYDMTVMPCPAYGGPPLQEGGRLYSEPLKYEFAVNLVEVGPNMIQVIKVIRDLTTWGLKECKDFVDLARVRPQVVTNSSSRGDAMEMRKKLEAAGAKVTVT
jgi:ribosomal protein L7/L12